MMKIYLMFAINIENLKTLKKSYIFKKTLDFSNVYSKCSPEYKKVFKGEDTLEPYFC